MRLHLRLDRGQLNMIPAVYSSRACQNAVIILPSPTYYICKLHFVTGRSVLPVADCGFQL